jgi:undecaprenyl-diphosphatase
MRSTLARIERWELALVRRQSTLAKRRWVRSLARVLNHLGNGWMYPIVAVLFLWRHPAGTGRALLTGGLAVGLAQVFCQCIKRVVARPRPFDTDPSLKPLVKTLDRYSFPSGHCMTVVCVGIPISVVLPEAAMYVVVSWMLIAWQRLVTAHHYPSDVFAGSLVGLFFAKVATDLLM